MAKFVIKESVLKNYISSIIRETIETESRGKQDPQVQIELDKMLSGQTYNRGVFPTGGKAFQIEMNYRKERGLPPLRKPKGGIVPYLIDGDGNDITPENSPDQIAHRLNMRGDAHRETERLRHVDKGNREERQQMHANLGLDGADNGSTNAVNGEDVYTQRWLNMTPEERAEQREKILQMRKNDSAAKLDNYRREVGKLSNRGLELPSAEHLKQRIVDLKARQAALGPHTDANDYDWKRYDYIIKDTQKILSKYFDNVDIDAMKDDVVDAMVADADKDIENDSKFAEEAAALGDDYVAPSTKFKGQEDIQPIDTATDNDEEEDDDDDAISKYGKKYKRDFKAAQDMGLFDNLDDMM